MTSVLPRTIEDRCMEQICTLLSVGDYVSAAFARATDNATTLIIDVNLIRIMGRLFGVRYNALSRRGKAVVSHATYYVMYDALTNYRWPLRDFAAKACIVPMPA